MTRRATPLLLCALALAGCGGQPASGPIEVGVIGGAVDPARPPAPDRAPLDAPAAVLAVATAQGLVRFDAGGQVIPGLAVRWMVSDSGRSLIFRLADPPAHGPPAVTAETVARRLRAAIAPASRNPLKPLLGAIAEIKAVTPQVIDVELSAPRPSLLDLFAQPALGVPLARGGGPFAVVAATPAGVSLRARSEADADPDGADNGTPAPVLVHLRDAPAGRAVARFAAGRSALVLGGGFADLPVARALAWPRGVLRFDPAPGLFGLAFAAATSGLTALPAARRALAMAIDRDRIARLTDVPGWQPTAAIVARGTPEIADPATPDWADRPLDDRRVDARRLIAGLVTAGRPPPPLRVAMPAGPGARLLFAAIAADWRAIGVAAVAVGERAAADLRLIDEVAPVDSAAFYLRRFACAREVACTLQADAVLIAARVAPTLDARAALLARADGLIVATAPFIALGSPVRWSLVAPELDRYRDSPRAIHPLDELRSPPKG